ncbi:MAG TPA: putative Ig domain-containing protein, partial [Longimicrobium sp.]|nr:putative Ig domain-containing protein [Longimicrobium sp.]
RVEVSAAAGRGKALRALRVSPLDAAPRAAEAAAAVAPQAFVVLLCRFADDASSPVTTGQMETVMGPTYPGMRHYYAELSGDPGVMAANRVAGWFDLPRPRSAYVNGTETDHGALARDCAAAADPTVDFAPYYGIAFQLNGALAVRSTPPYDTLSYGGSWSLTVDGAQRVFGTAWFSGGHATNYMAYAHEIGHGLGWPHSSGRYGQEYDSNWDVMSRGYLRFEQPWGWHSIHTIAPHKDQKGWIPAARRWLPAPASEERGSLVRGALPPDGDTYLIARIPRRLFDTWYTVEARRVAGYDNPLPGEAVLIHELLGTRAFVVDPDLNGNPNDAGAMWLPGETFTDSIEGVQVLVTGETAGRFDVTIRRGWRLAVAVQGAGSVRVAEKPAGCAADCAWFFDTRNAPATLAATPAPGYQFAGWSGACAGTAACTLAMGGERLVTARFTAGPGAPEIATDTLLRAATMGAAYADTLEVSGATGAPAWSVTGGALPEGVSLEAATGRLAGVPAASGTFRFTASVTAGAFTGARTFRLEVGTPTLAAAAVMDHLLGGPRLGADAARYLDLLGNRNGRVDVGDARAWLDATGALAAEARALREALDALAPKPAPAPSTRP